MFILGAAAARTWSDLSRAVLRNSSFIILICNEKSAESRSIINHLSLLLSFFLWRWRIFPCRSGCPPVPRERYRRYSHLTLPRPPVLYFSVHPSREYPVEMFGFDCVFLFISMLLTLCLCLCVWSLVNSFSRKLRPCLSRPLPRLFLKYRIVPTQQEQKKWKETRLQFGD